MLNLDPAKLFVILVVAFVVLGPDRLPRVARQLGAAWRELTRIRSEVSEEVRAAFPLDDLPHLPHLPNASAAVSSFVSGLTDPIRSTLGDAVSATRGKATGGSDQVIAEVEPESAPWLAAPGDGSGPHADDGQATRSAMSEGRAPVVPSPEDWSLFADDPSMN